jgi:hypothetical protein
MRTILNSLLLLTVPILVQAQPPDSLWSRTYGGSAADYASYVEQTADGGYLLAGGTYSFGLGSSDFWLLRANSNGDSLWSRTYGGNSLESCFSAQLTSDSGCVLAGYTFSFGAGNADCWLVRTNADGDSLWSRTLGGASTDQGISVRQTSDNGYILGGQTLSFGAGNWDAWLVRTDADGDSLWSRTFGGGNVDACLSARQTTDVGYILAGYTISFGAGNEDFWLVKTDSIGDSLWSQTFGGDSSDVCRSVRQTFDDGYILAGYTRSFGAGNEDFWLVRTDGDGDSLWSRTFGGGGSEFCLSIEQTADSGFVLIGQTNSFGAGDFDFWLLKTDSNGDSLWSRTFGGRAADRGRSVQQLSDGSYVLAGSAESIFSGEDDFWLVKTGRDCQLPLLPPEELVVWADGDSLRLAWRPTPCATSYDVRWSPEPFGGVWSLLTSTSDTAAVDTMGVSAKRFYSLKATN